MEFRYLSCFIGFILFTAPVVIILLYGAGYSDSEVGFLSRGNGVGILASKFSQLLLSNRATYKGYVLGWHYYEEQTKAAKNMLSLQYWAASIEFAVVEPFMHNSYFAAKPFFSEGESLRFSDYFDINIWNCHIIRNGFAKPLVPWEEFIE